MTKQTLINHTIQSLSQLPVEKIKEVSDYSEFLLKKYEEETLNKGIEKLLTNSKSYEFLKDEEDIYTVADLKVRYK